MTEKIRAERKREERDQKDWLDFFLQSQTHMLNIIWKEKKKKNGAK